MIVKIELNNVTFTDWLIYLANRSIKGSYLYESVLEIPRAELIKKSDYLFSILEECYEPETVTEDLIRELICYDNWGGYSEDDNDNEE